MRQFMAYFWQREFVKRLSYESGISIRLRDLRCEIAHLPPGHVPGEDNAKRFNLILVESLHAAVIILERGHGLNSTEAVRVAGNAFSSSGTWLARGFIRLWLKVERDPFAGMKKRGPSNLARAMWGEGMTVEEHHGPDTVSLCVLSCPFHEYFWNVGRSDLTPVLCAWETAWHDEVNASAKPIRVDIRNTIALGAEVCEFVFHRPDQAKGRR